MLFLSYDVKKKKRSPSQTLGLQCFTREIGMGQDTGGNKDLKVGKTPGSNGVTAEMLKYRG